ncbi:MAG: 2-deoxy-D-gluconate 3-dehydrogenase [Chloroflexi bacterium]|nr:glucose 1-dehydrogenase [Dehalococcoidia bacterium]PCJ72704.1 MAG: 2-deoxy-D-gluconate 3-dehydrogenase [Dehalococcoidia bacterium]RUA20734.1 MAG: 2-deoxy-D-gluconate 3-dehydrogenase [Chloroflexota bacterium]RUA32821.1 MAG: 2-deoxy-D-gluconate 3-dehydrogenase [Chloroflexota bacterium]HIM61830.1 glucose 1-dehydrogenase [Dehalococcoidia bacterium]
MSDLSQFDLTGKVAVVTGGNGGIGLGIAMGLAGAGANIVVAARSVEKTAQALEDIRALGVEAYGITVDVTQEPAIQRMVTDTIDHMGRLDILVNNSGIAVRAQPQDLTAAQWDSVVDVNLRAAFLTSKEVYSHMVNAGGGKVINVGSMYSLFGSDWGAPYAASKAGLVQLTKSLAVAWAKDNIQVNAVLPGWFVTDLTRGIPEADPDRYDNINRRIPTGRWGEPSELGGAAVFLASAASDYVTGATLTVDGGYSSA